MFLDATVTHSKYYTKIILEFISAAYNRTYDWYIIKFNRKNTLVLCLHYDERSEWRKRDFHLSFRHKLMLNKNNMTTAQEIAKRVWTIICAVGVTLGILGYFGINPFLTKPINSPGIGQEELQRQEATLENTEKIIRFLKEKGYDVTPQKTKEPKEKKTIKNLMGKAEAADLAPEYDKLIEFRTVCTVAEGFITYSRF